MYSIEELEKTFKLHHEKSAEVNKKLRKEFQKNNPGEPIPDPFNDDFSLPLALESMCKEISFLKSLHDAPIREVN